MEWQTHNLTSAHYIFCRGVPKKPTHSISACGRMTGYAEVISVKLIRSITSGLSTLLANRDARTDNFSF
jgi:hypothetical protein